MAWCYPDLLPLWIHKGEFREGPVYRVITRRRHDLRGLVVLLVKDCGFASRVAVCIAETGVQIGYARKAGGWLEAPQLPEGVVGY